MPERTNEFQELVSLIEKAFARDGDVVIDSASERGQGLETQREIDILIRSTVGHVTIKIAVEVVDDTRKVDVTNLEQYVSKYRGEGRVCVDKFIVVSRNGFTEGAIEKARLLGIPLYTLDEAKNADWSMLGPQHGVFQKPLRLKYRVEPHFHQIVTVPALPIEIAKEIIEKGRVRFKCGDAEKDHGHFGCYVRAVTIGSPDPRMIEALRKLDEAAQGDSKGALLGIGFRLPVGAGVLHADIDYPIREVHVVVHVAHGDCAVNHTAYQMSGTDGCEQVIHHLSADIGIGKLNFALPDGLGSKRGSVSLTASNPRERAGKRKRKSKHAKRKAKES